MNEKPREPAYALIGLVALFAVGYPLWWLASGITAWGQNESVRCEIGYDPVTSLCSDRVPSKCSGWSPPGFCWRRPEPQTGDGNG